MSNQNEPIRVLHIVGRMDPGGIETMIMNLYRNIDRTKIQFDFMAHYGREATYNEEIRSLGGRIYEMPALKDDRKVYYWRLLSYIRSLSRFFKEHQEYKMIHCHMTNTASIYMPIAKKNGVKCIIAHSHNTAGKPGLLGIITNLLQKRIYKDATDWFSCSKAAASWFYPNGSVKSGKVIVLANAVDAEKFRFDSNKRNKMRDELNIKDKVVIGCVARLRPEKNHVFLLDVFNEILKIEPSAILLLAGDGPLEKELKDRAAMLGLKGKVLFLGMRTDIPDVLQAIDVFTLTSLWEGLPVSGIEAQAAGLHCVVSDGVTTEMNPFNMVEYLSLDESKEEWALRLIKAAKTTRNDTYEMVKKAGYDIHTTAPWLQQFYLEKYKEIEGEQ